MGFIDQSAIERPIPDMSMLREKKEKEGYDSVALDAGHPLFNDPIVRLKDYGVRGSSYYANHTWLQEGSGVDEALKEVYVRQDIAERLRVANDFLASQEAAFIREALQVEHIDLYVTDGTRPLELVRLLYEKIAPENLRRDHPDWSEEEITAERNRRAAAPNQNAPHCSGGAIDLVLSDKDTGQKIPNGMIRENPETVWPEYYEMLGKERTLTEEERHALIVRRVLFHLMLSVPSERGGGSFVNNAMEFWHYGTGDKMSGFMAGRAAYYGAATLPASS